MGKSRKNLFQELLASFLVFLIIAGLFRLGEPAQAATYTFTQSSWSGGATSNNAVHPTNQTGWNQYSAASSGASAGSVIAMASTTLWVKDDGTFSTSTPNNVSTGGGFSNGTNSGTAVSGSGSAASVALTRTGTANAWSALAAPPVTLKTSVFDNNGNIYAGSVDYNFYKYSVASNSWSAKAGFPGYIGPGFAMTYDNGGNVYALRGYSFQDFWKYSIASNSWTAMASIPAAVRDGGSLAYGNDGNVYALRGNGSTDFYKYSIASNSWTALTSVSVAVGNGSGLSFDKQGNFYALVGNYATGFYKYSVASNSWSAVTSHPAGNGTDGGLLAYDDSGSFYAAADGPSFYKYSTFDSYPSSGTFESATIDLGGKSDFSTLNFSSSASGGSSVKFQLATSDSSSGPFSYVGSDGTSGTYFTSSGTAIPSSLGGKRYARYKAYFTGGGGGWQQLASASVEGVSELEYGDDGNVYAFTGSSLLKYNASSNSWSSLTSPPVSFTFPSGAFDGNGNFYFQDDNGSKFYKYGIALNTSSDVTNGLGGTANASDYNGDRPPAYAFNEILSGDIPGAWMSNTMPAWISIDLGSPKAVGRVKIYPRDLETNRYPKDMQLYGSSDNASWTSIASFTFASNASPHWETFDISNSNAYRYYKINISTNYGGLYVGIAEIEMYAREYLWSSLTPQATYWGTDLVYNDKDNIYATLGNGVYAYFGKYNLASDSWSSLANTPPIGASLVYDKNGNIYAFSGSGNYSSNFYKYNLVSASFSQMASPPASSASYISTAYDNNGGIYVLAQNPSNSTQVYFWKYDIASNGWTTLTSPSENAGVSGVLAYDKNGALYFGRTAWQSSSLRKFYTYATSTALLNDITINYSQFSSAADLTSSKYDTNDAANLISKISWSESATTTAESVKFQVRSSSDGTSWSGWCGYVDSGSTCAGTNYFDYSNNGLTLASNHPLRSNGNDRWFQYKTFLASGGAATPSVSSVTVQYVVNAPPDFNSSFGTNGISVTQVADSADANWGKAVIQYAIRDPDGSSGSVTPGYVTPSIEYDIGSGWTAITASYLNSGALDNKAVSDSGYTTYSAVWDAKTQIPNVYSATARIRITLNDNEAANNTAQATSANFALDTKAPATSYFRIDSSTDAVMTGVSDDSNIQYRVSNNGDMSADGLNGTSGQWQVVGAPSLNATTTWTLTGSPSYETTYLETRDAYGNSAASSATAPLTPSNFYLKDVSNVNTGEYRLFVSWNVYSATSTAQFSKYEVYRSTDGSSYSLYSTVTNVDSNYFIDNTVASSTTYYYKTRIVDTGGDISNYSAEANDRPNGQGGTDVTAPSISGVTVAEAQSTWARITWTTDELSDSKIEYSVSPSASFNLSKSVNTMVTSHSLVVDGLTPNATYLFRVKSKDVYGNEGSDSNGGAGYSLTTAGGPVISDVTAINVSDRSATVFWNSDKDSDSKVFYSTNSGLSGATEAGSASLVGGSASSTIFQHQVGLTALNPGTTYYYYVKSTDALGNASVNNNNGNYYNFTTTADTKAPTISDISTPVLSSTAAVIVWKTDEPATTQSSYGGASGSYSGTTALDSVRSVYHIVSLSGLSANTTYYYLVKSKDEAGNEAISSEQSFQTAAEGTVQIVVLSGGVPSLDVAKDTTPPVISGARAESVSAFDAVIAAETNEPAAIFVEYGKAEGGNYGMVAGSPDWLMSHSVRINNLRLGTEYAFRIKAIDKDGNTAISDSQSFKTDYFAEAVKGVVTVENISEFQKEVEKYIESIAPSLVPPFIEEPKATDITEDSAAISWKTNVPAYSIVSYAPEDLYDFSAGSYAAEISDTEIKTADHRLVLIGLSPNARYHFMVKSFSVPGAVGKSGDLTFVTKAAKINPKITGVENDGFAVAWLTDEPATSVVEYRNVKTGETNRRADEVLKTYHEMKISGLPSAVVYEVRASGYNEKGNLLESGKPLRVTTTKDVAPPVIGDFRIDNAFVPGRTDRIQTVIGWKTDEPATSVVYYQDGSGAVDEKLANKTEVPDLVADHAVILTNLKPGVIYRVKIESVDASGNAAEFGPRTIITPRQSESVINVIFKNFENTFKFLKNVGQ
ncbi:MAG: fibronectin type III domain-containing protein [Parcubacteria group bacterium]|nr:fibronectin type III domain-containing protein [Parcubacteria group bacterium]